MHARGLLALCAAAALTVAIPSEANRSFVISDDKFVKDGQPILVMSGSFHYSRAPSGYWRDRVQRLAAMGLNAIQTYVPWNFHEERSGEFDFMGDRDLGAFLDICADEGLLVLLRSGPYMCGEWEFGGLPAWLISVNSTMQVRTYDDAYIKYVDRFWEQLFAVVKPRLYSNGGSVVMVQVENEYGSYGDVSKNPDDKRYIEHLVERAGSLLGNSAPGVFDKVVLYTTDGGNEGYMTRGSLPGPTVYTVGDHGPSDDKSNCEAMAKFNPAGMNPCMDSEYYTGWLTHWGERMANTSSSPVSQDADVMLSTGHSINLYMGYGGTNFGHWSGANGGGKSYSPHITSYDYDSPVSEGGEHGYGSGGNDKYAALQAVFGRYRNMSGISTPMPDEPPLPPRESYDAVTLTESCPMLSSDALSVLAPNGPIRSDMPQSMEAYGQRYGFILYEAETPAVASGPQPLEIVGYPRDRVQVFLDGKEACDAIYRPDAAPVSVNASGKASTLRLLAENCGRLNYGRGFWDPKGIVDNVTYAGETLVGPNLWSAYNMELDPAQVAALPFKSADELGADFAGPTFFRGKLHIESSPADTYIVTNGWVKGQVWVNGHGLGRYWEEQGPQHTLYCPAPFLVKGDNEIIILELHPGQMAAGGAHRNNASAVPKVAFATQPDFSGKPSASCKPNPGAGSVLRMYKCDPTRTQGWNVAVSDERQKGSSVQLGSSGLCLAYRSSDKAAILATCNSSDPAQDFTVPQATDSAAGYIQNEATNLCLDVANHDQSDGAPVDFWSKTGTPKNQMWTLQQTPAHTAQIIVQETGKCLTACA